MHMEEKKEQQRRKKASAKRSRSNNNNNYKQVQALKIVHISNPLKLETCPSNFRSLVQELTGQGAVWPLPNSSKFSSSSSSSVAPHNSNTALGILDSTADPIQPLDEDNDDDDDDRVVLIDRRLLNTFLDDHYDHFTGLIHPPNSRKN